METTEKIVEAYVRYIKGWFTIANIRCKGQKEIDLLAIDTQRKRGLNRYHIEISVSISGSFSKLTNDSFAAEDMKDRVKAPSKRRTIQFFKQMKFEDSDVLKTLAGFGFKPGNYEKVIVTWGWKEDVPEVAKQMGIKIWDFKKIMNEISQASGSRETYFIDDTMRTLQLMAKSLKN